jgi:AraC-like DNA-binding protein
MLHIPSSIALLRVAGLIPVTALLRRIGAPVQRILARAQLPGAVFDSPEGLIPVPQALRFLQDSVRETGIRDLVLIAGRDMEIEGLGIFGRLIRRARTLQEAVEVAVSAMPAFNSGARLRLDYEGNRARLSLRLVEGLEAFEQADRYCSMVALSVLRLATTPQSRPDDFRLEVGATIALRRQGAAITFPRSLLGRPLAPASDARQIDGAEVAAWKASAPAADFPGSVRQVMTTLSSPEYPRIGRTANAIGVSVRALQRRLAETGMSYGGLVARARFATAVELLEHTDATVLDIALDLGYSDHAHFTRAFRRWTGVAPREFRVSRRMPGVAPGRGSQRRVVGTRTVAM